MSTRLCEEHNNPGCPLYIDPRGGGSAVPEYMYCGKAVGTYNGGAIDADARRQHLLDAKQCAASTDAVDCCNWR